MHCLRRRRFRRSGRAVHRTDLPPAIDALQHRCAETLPLDRLGAVLQFDHIAIRLRGPGHIAHALDADGVVGEREALELLDAERLQRFNVELSVTLRRSCSLEYFRFMA